MATTDDIKQIVYHTNKYGRIFEQYQVECKLCGTVVTIPKGRLKRFSYCSKDCSKKALNPISPRIKYNCQLCSIECESTPFQYSKSKNHFCSHECSDRYRSIIKTVYNKCAICNHWFPVIKSMVHQICCSTKCQGAWQSKNLIGENANRYRKDVSEEMRTHECDWCGKERVLKPYDISNKLNKGRKYFCGMECYREWYAKDWSQQEDWKNKARIRAVEMLSNGTFNKTDTAPQLILNELLSSLNIKYINEYNCTQVAIDSYLPEYNHVRS